MLKTYMLMDGQFTNEVSKYYLREASIPLPRSVAPRPNLNTEYMEESYGKKTGERARENEWIVGWEWANARGAPFLDSKYRNIYTTVL